MEPGAEEKQSPWVLVDAPPSVRRSYIFVGSKAPWFEITDDLPQFDEYAE